MLRISIETIPHHKQRYDTAGDYRVINSVAHGVQWHIDVSRMVDWRFEFLVALHELVEMGMCISAGVPMLEIDRFDMDWKPRPQNGIHEPGNDPAAPYYRQHKVATDVEFIVSRAMDVNWDEYERTLNMLDHAKPSVNYGRRAEDQI